MKWRCALIQRWLPAYPDGDLPAFWRGIIKSHLKGCPACREELAGLEEVVRRVKAVPEPDPGADFWESFNRELHLKLAQSMPAPRPSRFSKIPYLVGAPALAVLLIWVAVGYLKPERPVLAPQPQVAKKEQAPETKTSPARVAAPSLETTGTVVYVAQNGDEMPPEDDDLLGLRGDLDSTLAGMTDKEKEAFLKRLRQHEKDGSCLRKNSVIFWA